MPKRGIIISIVWWLVLMAALVVLFSLHTQGHNSGLTKFYTIGVFLFGVAGQTGISAYFDRQRLRALNADLASRNFVTNLDEGQPAQVLHYHATPEHTGFRAFFSALGVHADRPIHIAEYRFTIGEGKQAKHTRVTEVAADFLPAAPELLLTRKPTAALKKGNPANDQSRFNERWHASVPSSILTTDLMKDLGNADPAELQWRIKEGWLSCTWHKTCQPAELEPLIQRVLHCAKLAELHRA